MKNDDTVISLRQILSVLYGNSKLLLLSFLALTVFGLVFIFFSGKEYTYTLSVELDDQFNDALFMDTQKTVYFFSEFLKKAKTGDGFKAVPDHPQKSQLTIVTNQKLNDDFLGHAIAEYNKEQKGKLDELVNMFSFGGTLISKESELLNAISLVEVDLLLECAKDKRIACIANVQQSVIGERITSVERTFEILSALGPANSHSQIKVKLSGIRNLYDQFLLSQENRIGRIIVHDSTLSSLRQTEGLSNRVKFIALFAPLFCFFCIFYCLLLFKGSKPFSA